MEKILKIILILVVVYLLIGIIFATRHALNYNPATTSFPNNWHTFIMNTILWAF